MSIRFHCACGREFRVSDGAAGKKAKCLDCGRRLIVPRPHKAAAAPSGPAAPKAASAARASARPAAPARTPAARCGAHEALWGQPEQIQPGQGFLLAAAFMQQSAVQERNIAVGVSMGFTREQYKAQLQGIQGSSPWLLCGKCTDFLRLDGADKQAARDAAANWWRKGGHGPGHVPARAAGPAPEDEVPLARLAAAPVRRHPFQRGPSLGAVRVAVGIAILVMLATAMDVLIALAKGIRGGARGVETIHAVWLAVMLIGFFVAVAAARGSRACIGILIGGAFQNLIVNGPALLILSQTDFTKRLGDLTAQVVMLVGWGSMALGAVYVVLLLFGSHRRYLAGHGGTVAAGAIGGVLFGWVMALTALPNPGVVATHILASPDSMVGLAQAWQAPELIGASGKKDIKVEMQNRMVHISRAFQVYINENHNYMPADLGALVGKEGVKVETFLAPGSRRGVPQLDEKTRAFQGPTDVVYVMVGYHLFDLPDDPDELKQFVVLHTDPNCHFGEGAVVMRPPGRNLELIQWVPKDMLRSELSYTRNWMNRQPPRAPMEVSPSGAPTDPPPEPPPDM